ncbi:MAG: MoxR-like ATPase [Parasphingorhabdus sp.]|jgi:MoxR-like ATPase
MDSMQSQIPESTGKDHRFSQQVTEVKKYLEGQVIGQQKLVNRLLIGLLADGHILVEGAPGLAKTRAVRALSDCIDGEFHRIQFTPDLLPADLTGTEVFRPQNSTFEFQKGPLFHSILLADEINRAPAKVQSALLESMAERQITVGRQTYPLPDLFMVMATQNPIEQEGTYPLPEAQLDRFLLHLSLDYPSADSEVEILQLARREALNDIERNQVVTPPRLSQADIFSIRRNILNLYMAPGVEAYIVQIILATRDPSVFKPEMARLIEYGASPRATISLDRCARAHAWLDGRDFVSPDDVRQLAADVLRHRIILSYEAEADGINADAFLAQLLDQIPLP